MSVAYRGPEADPVAEADLATHTALKRGVHGIPSSVGSGQGLVGDGSGGWTAVDIATQAEQDAAFAAYDAPFAKVGMSAAQSLANNTAAGVAFNTEAEDAYNQHDNATNNSRLTCVKAGVYSVSTVIEWAFNATGRRVVQVAKNGEASSFTWQLSTILPSVGGSVGPVMNLSGPVRLAVGDYLEVVAFQNSGGALNVGSALSWFAWTWLRS